jgi:hypothetical protein
LYFQYLFYQQSREAAYYRPIALTATMCKLMESVIKDQMASFLLDNGLISNHQHAFVKHHSTATNLLECIRDWSIGLNCHWQTDVIYIDFTKAFDSIVQFNCSLSLNSLELVVCF